MKKLCLIFGVFLLVGCTSQTKEEPTPTPTMEVTPEPSLEPTEIPVVEETVEMQEIEGVLEEELPQTLTITIQDIVVVFTKDIDYECDDKLAVGDEIKLYYTEGNENSYILHRVEKK